MASWSEATLEAYLGDLGEAAGAGRNLLTEKYARMMESTSPAEYARIRDMLPPVDAAVPGLIGEIVKIVLDWEAELAQKYPHVLKRGRPLASSEDRFGVTSLETYLRGELATYSPGTLRLYLANALRQKAAGINGSEVTLRHTAKHYGFESLESTNEKLKQDRRGLHTA